MKRNVEVLRDGTFDLLILGGGITGAGVALDAVLRGLRVALIDKGDFASATSSVSSKLVHGGLRYLEHGNFHLVYEALHERRLLLENAPHLVRPLRFVIPLYRGGRLARWKCRAGLTLYDVLAGASNLRRSRPMTSRCLQDEFPGLQGRNLYAGAEYFDAQMDDARLCIEVVRTAARQGACVANYVEAQAFEFRDGMITGTRAVDRIGNLEISIRSRRVLNATGPWVDAVCRLAGDFSGPHLSPTKGVHVIVPDQGLQAAFLLLHPRDGRVLFVIPWSGKTLIGTTDTVDLKGPDHLEVTGDDVKYLLEAHNHYFTTSLTSRDLLGSFAGLRPLLRSGPGEPSALSREFRIFESPSGLVSVAGGKYTTYRRMAEVITDRIMSRLGRRTRCRTRAYRLDGSPPGPWKEFEATGAAELGEQYGLRERAAQHVIQRYGRRAADVAAYLIRDPRLAEPVVLDEPDLHVEFAYQRDMEMAVCPADFLLRRTRLGLFRPDLLKNPPSDLDQNASCVRS